MERRAVLKVGAVIDCDLSNVTAVACDQSGARVWTGLADGTLEAYSVAGGVATLAARKRLYTHALTVVRDLSAFNALVVASGGEGTAHVLDCETLEAQPLPARHVAAVCVTIPPGRLPRLAIASKSSRRAIRLSVCELQPTVQGKQLPLLASMDLPEPSAPTCMAWVGDRLVVATTAGNCLLAAPLGQGAGQWRVLLSVATAPAAADGQQPLEPAVVAAVPQLGRALLLVREACLLVDEQGNPVGSALRMDSLPPPRALVASGMHVLAVCNDGLHVFDTESGAEVQHLELGLHGAPAAGLAGAPLLLAGDPSGSSVAVAGWGRVWLCVPVSLEDQVQELLAQRKYSQALELTELGARQGAPWVGTAFAQAGLLLLHDCRFEEAAAVLERCTPAVFQPVQLVELFPDDMEPWLGQALSYGGQRSWALHPPLAALDVLITRQLSAGQAGTSSSRAAAEQLEPRSTAEHDEQSSTEQQSQQPPPDPGWKLQHAQLQQQALQALAPYLFRARALGDVACPQAVDTLLLLLLIKLGAAEEAAAFATMPNCVDVDLLAPKLQATDWHHVLAVLLVGRGHVAGALGIWQRILEGSLAAAGACPQARQDALDAVAALLKNSSASSDAQALACAPWLLAASEAVGLEVLKSRSLAPTAVLPLLPAGGDARWRYLAHLVGSKEGGGCTDPVLHTELALELAAAVLRAAPLLQLDCQQELGSPRPSPLGGAAAETAVDTAVAAMRLSLQQHLQTSTCYDGGQVLQTLQGTGLYIELVAVHRKMGNHMAALRLLVLTLHDVAAAERYARAHLPPSDYHALLELVLAPGPGLQPHYSDAAYLVAALGDALDPLDLLACLPSAMPLEVAVGIVAPMLRDRLQRRRQGQLAKGLQRSLLTGARAARDSAEARSVVVSEERACPRCHLRLGSRVFVVDQELQVVCLHCWRNAQ